MHGCTRLREATLEHQFNRRQFLVGAAGVAILGMTGSLFACSPDNKDEVTSGNATDDSSNSSNSNDKASVNTEPITFVFLPDSSSADLTESRNAVAEAIKNACGRDAKIMTTTDYNVTIEAIASGSAGMGLFGAEGYVQANRKNNKVQSAFTASDENGTLDGACYYSRICVRTEDVDEYRDGSGFTLEPLRGKSFSFVSATSTSGFKVPGAKLVSEFDLSGSEVLLERGAFFSEILFGNSHQGSVVNLMSGDVDAAAFDDVDVDMYLEIVSGEANMPGSVYKVRDDAGDPFTSVRGKQFTIISVTPVLNAPFVFNEDKVTATERDAIVRYFCSSAVSNDKRIFSDPDDKDAKALNVKRSEKMCYLPVADSWYDPIRLLS